MHALKLDALPECPTTQIRLAIHRGGLIAPHAQLTNAELISIACDADARNAQVLGSLITLIIEEV